MDVDFRPIVPAALLTLGLLGVILTDLMGRGRKPAVPTLIALIALAAAAVYAMAMTPSDDIVLGVLQADSFGIVFTVFCCVVGLVSVLATMRGEAFRTPGGEFLTLVLSAVLGMSLLAMSTDLIMLYLAFETVSIPSYVLVGMRRGDSKANEASMKYVLFGAVSSALMLYGLSMIVGLSGSTSLEAFSAAVQNGAASQPMFLVASALVLAGFAFKISAVPFHFWAPDVYAGAPAAVGGFLAVASKAAGFAALVRVVGAAIPDPLPPAADPLTSFLPTGNALITGLAVLGLLTTIIGNLAALRQREIKRLLAWSSIAHAGYILLALAVWTPSAVAALLVYLVAYLFMNLAAFLIAGIVIRERGSGDLESFRGMGRKQWGISLALAIALFSLTGLPPFFGFIGKLTIFYAIFEQGYVWLGVIGLLGGVVSLWYYARVIKYMYLMDEVEGEPTPGMRVAFADHVLCAALTIPILVFGIFWSPIWEWAKAAVPSFMNGA